MVDHFQPSHQETSLLRKLRDRQDHGAWEPAACEVRRGQVQVAPGGNPRSNSLSHSPGSPESLGTPGPTPSVLRPGPALPRSVSLSGLSKLRCEGIGPTGATAQSQEHMHLSTVLSRQMAPSPEPADRSSGPAPVHHHLRPPGPTPRPPPCSWQGWPGGHPHHAPAHCRPRSQKTHAVQPHQPRRTLGS